MYGTYNKGSQYCMQCLRAKNKRACNTVFFNEKASRSRTKCWTVFINQPPFRIIFWVAKMSNDKATQIAKMNVVILELVVLFVQFADQKGTNNYTSGVVKYQILFHNCHYMFLLL